MQIADGVWLVDGARGANVYVLAAEDGAVIVDTGVRGSHEAILSEVRIAGWQPDHVRAIVLTHAHMDHIGSLPELQQATGALVCATAGEAEAIEGRAPLPHPPGVHGALLKLVGEAMRPAPVAVQQILTPGQAVPFLPGWRVLHTIGHTLDHISLYHPERQFLIAGDAVANMGGLKRSPWIVTSNMPLAQATVAMLAGLPLRNGAWGHGAPIIDDPTLSGQLAAVARADRSQMLPAR